MKNTMITEAFDFDTVEMPENALCPDIDGYIILLNIKSNHAYIMDNVRRYNTYSELYTKVCNHYNINYQLFFNCGINLFLSLNTEVYDTKHTVAILYEFEEMYNRYDEKIYSNIVDAIQESNNFLVYASAPEIPKNVILFICDIENIDNILNLLSASFDKLYVSLDNGLLIILYNNLYGNKAVHSYVMVVFTGAIDLQKDKQVALLSEPLFNIKLNEAFDFNEISNNTTDITDIDNTIKTLNHKDNVKYIKTVSDILYQILGIHYNLGYKNMVYYMDRSFSFSIYAEYIVECKNSVACVLSTFNSDENVLFNDFLEAVDVDGNHILTSYSKSDDIAPILRFIYELADNKITVLQDLPPLDIYTTYDNNIIIARFKRWNGNNTIMIIFITDGFNFKNPSYSNKLSTPIYINEAFDFNNEVKDTNADDELIHGDFIKKLNRLTNLKNNKEFIKNSSNIFSDILHTYYGIQYYSGEDILPFFNKSTSIVKLEEIENNLIYEIKSKAFNALDTICEEIFANNDNFLMLSIFLVLYPEKLYMLKEITNLVNKLYNSKNNIYTIDKMYISNDEGIIICHLIGKLDWLVIVTNEIDYTTANNTLNEAFDFNNEVLDIMDNDDLPVDTKEAMRKNILMKLCNALLDEYDNILPTYRGNKYDIFVKDDVLYIGIEYTNSMCFRITLLDIDNPLFHIVGYKLKGIDYNESEIISYIFTISNFIHYLFDNSFNKLSVNYSLWHNDVIYKYPTQFYKSYKSKTKIFVLTKDIIKTLPKIVLPFAKTNLLIADIIFDDLETIDTLVDSIYEFNTPANINIKIKTPVLNNEPAYNFYNRRNPGTTGRYMRKSIQRYTRKSLKESFDFNNIEAASSDIDLNIDEIKNHVYLHHNDNLITNSDTLFKKVLCPHYQFDVWSLGQKISTDTYIKTIQLDNKAIIEGNIVYSMCFPEKFDESMMHTFDWLMEFTKLVPDIPGHSEYIATVVNILKRYNSLYENNLKFPPIRIYKAKDNGMYICAVYHFNCKKWYVIITNKVDYTNTAVSVNEAFDFDKNIENKDADIELSPETIAKAKINLYTEHNNAINSSENFLKLLDNYYNIFLLALSIAYTNNDKIKKFLNNIQLKNKLQIKNCIVYEFYIHPDYEHFFKNAFSGNLYFKFIEPAYNKRQYEYIKNIIKHYYNNSFILPDRIQTTDDHGLYLCMTNTFKWLLIVTNCVDYTNKEASPVDFINTVIKKKRYE